MGTQSLIGGSGDRALLKGVPFIEYLIWSVGEERGDGKRRGEEKTYSTGAITCTHQQASSSKYRLLAYPHPPYLPSPLPPPPRPIPVPPFHPPYLPPIPLTSLPSPLPPSHPPYLPPIPLTSLPSPLPPSHPPYFPPIPLPPIPLSPSIPLIPHPDIKMNVGEFQAENTRSKIKVLA